MPLRSPLPPLTTETCYPPGTEAEVEETLRDEKGNEPKRIPYYLLMAPGHPGYFELMYLPGGTIRKERFEVTPAGYRMGRETLRSCTELLKFFKENAARQQSSSSRR
ncbi:unnamed protein product, partial [Phaeothamnion confervicola]